MANEKLTQLPSLSAASGNTLFYVVDVSDPTDDPSGSSKQITRDDVLKNISGFTADTISATTYQNLPTDIRVTGGTYSNGTATFTNNTGGTFTVTGFTATTAYNTDYIDFNTGATVTAQYGRLYWDSGAGTLSVGIGDSGTGLIDFQVGQEEVVRVYNEEATTLLKGEIVYVFGSQGNRPSVKRALATGDGYSVTTLGMVTSNITSGGQGYVTTFGIVSNLNTLGLTGGTAIWLSPTVAGGYTETKPQAPNHTVLIGYVVRVSATVGSIFVNISNGWELDELHDVRISGATEGDLLMRSSYSGSPVWVNTKTLNGSYTITGNTNVGGNLTVSGNTNLQGLTATTISATTYQNLPVDPNYYVTAFTYSNNVFTIKQTGQSDLTALINTVTGWTVNGKLSVTGNTSVLGTLAIGKTGVTAGNQVDIKSDNVYNNGIYVGGGFITQWPSVGVNAFATGYGLQGSAASDGGCVGVYGSAGDQGGSVSGNFYGGQFIAGSTGNNYALQLQDGTQGIGKFLYSVDSAGSTNWTSDLSGTSATINGPLTVTGNTSLKSFTGTSGTINGNLVVTGGTSGATFTITSTPTNNNNNTQILSRNSSTGNVEYIDGTGPVGSYNYGMAYTILTGNYMV